MDLSLDGLVPGILEVGYKIPFKSLPIFQGIRQTPVARKYANVLLDKVSALLQKGAIEKILEKEREGYYSTYFLVPKMTRDQAGS